MTSGRPQSPSDSHLHAPQPSRPRSEITRTVEECRLYLSERAAARARRSSSRQREPSTFAIAYVIRPLSVIIGCITTVIAAVAGLIVASVKVFTRLPGRSSINQVVTSRIAWGTALLVIVAAAGIAAYSSLTKQQRQAAIVDDLAFQLRELRQRSADDQAWTDFALIAHQRLDRLVPELEAAADAGDRESIDLLWAARDYFPKMLSDARETPSESERQFDVCMRRVRGNGQ